MKKLILSCLSLALGFVAQAQSDIKTSVVSLSANNISVGTTTKLRYNVGNVGTSGSSYAPGTVQIVLSLPSAVFAYSSVDVPNGAFFSWVYDNANQVLIGTNHTAIGQNQSENVDVNLLATSAGTATGNINAELNPSAPNLSTDNDPSTFNLTVQGAAGPLPVRLLGFNGKRSGNSNQLTWNVASETNFSYYEVERSFNAKEYKALGKVNANGAKTYNYTDDFGTAAVKDAYYRLKLVDTDGKFEFSKVIFLNSESGSGFVGNAYPNPVVEQAASVEIKSTKQMPWTIVAYDMTGKQISKSTQTLAKGNNLVKINTKGANAGLVLVSYESEDGVFSEKIMVK